MNRYLRCPGCGVAEGEPIEDDVMVPCLAWDGEFQHAYPVRQVVREAYFNSIERYDGKTEYICSECGSHFTLEDRYDGYT